MTESKTENDETAGAVEIDGDETETVDGPDAAQGGPSPEEAEADPQASSDPDDAADDSPVAEHASTTDPDSAVDGPSSGDGVERAGPEPEDGGGSAGETELVALREEFQELNDRHLRLAAEFNNFRRRSEQERLSAWSRAQADLVGNLLDVLDDLHRVADLDLSNATVENIMEGIDLVERKFVRKLEEAGVQVIEPEGETFDPERMEAMMRVPAEDEDQVDTVADVFQKGYSLKGILVRPARVSVYTQG